MVRIKLSDENMRELDSMVKTTFWSPDGKPMSAEEFIKKLFGDLPTFFDDEEELRRIWSMPGTRKQLLEELSDKGYSKVQLKDLQKVIHGEDSDLFDVLSYIAYYSDLVPRLERAERAKVYLNSYDEKQQEFITFVLKQYIKDGVSELDDERLPKLLTLKYQAIANAKAELGDVSSIRDVFVGFQEFLYSSKAS